MAKSSYDIIKNVILTEKCTKQIESDSQYSFRVCTCANKREVKAAIEEIYGVKVKSVNIMNYQGKLKRMGRSPVPGRRSSWKKAVVSLAEGKIELQ